MKTKIFACSATSAANERTKLLKIIQTPKAFYCFVILFGLGSFYAVLVSLYTKPNNVQNVPTKPTASAFDDVKFAPSK
jgi:hypothetical protein